MAAHFIPPPVQDNEDGWGPMGIPERYKDLPYQPFSKVIMFDRIPVGFNATLFNIFTGIELDVRVGWRQSRQLFVPRSQVRWRRQVFWWHWWQPVCLPPRRRRKQFPAGRYCQNTSTHVCQRPVLAEPTFGSRPSEQLQELATRST